MTAYARPLGLLVLVWAVLILLLEPAGSSMMGIWERSETYAHGFVILPMALWLVWRKRREVVATPMPPDNLALILGAGVALVWLAGRQVSAQVVEHYALVGLLITAVWALFGRALLWTLLFPLFFLLLMVPAGDSLIEPLIHFTADFTVMTLRLIGIPVLQEGTFIELPSGQWNVVEECSGIRYFLSSIVLGWLYAYLTYKTWWKRVAFGVASIVVPVIANGFRAVIIVLLGHYSGMTLAVGVDHLIYGWVWFGIVMLAMFWVGAYWREDIDEPQKEVGAPLVPPRPAYLTAVGLITVVSVFSLYGHALSSREPTPSPLAGWRPASSWDIEDKPLSGWRPRWLGMDDQRTLTLGKQGKRVMLHMAWYGAQRQGAELINSQNVLVPEKDARWRNLEESNKAVQLRGGPVSLAQAKLYSPGSGQRLLVWYWYNIDGDEGVSSLKGKLHLAWMKLTGRGDAALAVAVAAPYVEKPEEAELMLQAFLEESRPGAFPASAKRRD